MSVTITKDTVYKFNKSGYKRYYIKGTEITLTPKMVIVGNTEFQFEGDLDTTNRDKVWFSAGEGGAIPNKSMDKLNPHILFNQAYLNYFLQDCYDKYGT